MNKGKANKINQIKTNKNYIFIIIDIPVDTCYNARQTDQAATVRRPGKKK